MALDPPYYRIQVYDPSTDNTSTYYLATESDIAVPVSDVAELVRTAVNEATGLTTTTVDSYAVVDTLVPPPT